MGSQNLNSGNEIGGSTKSSVTQLEPIFSYKVQDGNIYVYLIQTKEAKVALMTYGDAESKYAYSTMTLISNTGYEADTLVSSAIRHWEVQNNPFAELAKDGQAMRRLSKLVSQFYEGE